MSLVETRLIGLSDELQIERRSGVCDLHIGWQREDELQHQFDPSGGVHLAPVVRWYCNGKRYRHVPQLKFSSWKLDSKLGRMLRLPARSGYQIDRDALIRDIESAIGRSVAFGDTSEPQVA